MPNTIAYARKKGYNLNKMKAMMHNQVYLNLQKKAMPCLNFA